MQASWSSENVLLGLLCENPMHGYQLAQTVRSDQAIHAIWRFERSEVYFLLGKLAQRGHVAAAEVAKGGGPSRTIYAPTEAGRAAFLDWLRMPETQPRNLRTSVLARVYMALRHDPLTAVELVDAQRQLLEGWLEREQHRGADDDVVALVHRLRARQVEATIGALDDLRRLAQSRVATLAGAPAEGML